ncbi:MAG: ABC-type phosphate transport system permease component [Candidatus Methanohalarchaeum thermophilum]|uniref:Phosphate transport system permease protein PstA n=1 Tax=Methanohalarchaeum thermophilum TaxID=1903181 RepID=A0A1Q6DTF5_METT1|nr:MAG: ABC-type phosphate transport system permease component [Candidatus Methanohalarchaeum thermophilum]
MKDRKRNLVKKENRFYKYLALSVEVFSFLTFILGILLISKTISLSNSFLGLKLIKWIGLLWAYIGAGGVILGLMSYFVSPGTSPEKNPGLGISLPVVFYYFIATGCIISYLDGTALISFIIGLIVALAVFLVSIYLREDLSSTILPSLLPLVPSSLILTGIIDIGFNWNPETLGVVFNSTILLSVASIFLGILIIWISAKAYGGFGKVGRQKGAYTLFTVNSMAMVALLAVIIIYIMIRGLPVAFRGIEIGPGLSFDWPFVMNGYSITNEYNGVFPAIVGTVWLVFGAILLAVPLGVGAAVFLTEYGKGGRFTRLIETVTNSLWSTPSIVFGLFGYAFFVPRLGNSLSLLSGMIVLGFMLLPLVVITSRESIKSVPSEYRDASIALGVSKWETIKSVVVPSALPGVVTGIILGVGRIAGETAPILLVTGGEPFPSKAVNVLTSFELMGSPPFITNQALLEASSALPYQLYSIITAGVGAEGKEAFGWATAAILLLVVLSFYLIGIITRIYFRRKLNSE